MYKFKAIKPQEVSKEDFENAINCARNSVESVLDNEKIIVSVSGSDIKISSDNEDDMPFSLSECKEIIQGCFCDKGGALYPEFNKIIPTEIKAPNK